MPSPIPSPTHRLSAVLCVAVMSPCAGHFSGESASAPLPAPIDLTADLIQREVDTTFTRAEPAFTLTSTSQAGASLALSTLESTSRAFSSLFGQRPPPITVVVVDTTNPVRAYPRGGDGSKTITLVGAGLAGTAAGNAHVRQTFQKTLTLMAANAWVGSYASSWTGALVRRGVLSPEVMTDSAAAPVLPDWLQAASIHLLANADAAPQAARMMRAYADDAASLTVLFDYEIPQTSDDDLEEFLSDLSIGAMHPAAFRADVSPPRRQTALFLAEATSVLEFLRDVRGVNVTKDLYAPLLAGADIQQVLSRAPIATSIDDLESEWKRWVSSTQSPQGMASSAEREP
ncbi:MAG: hypothetical protein ABI625_05475 [bacterium]